MDPSRQPITDGTFATGFCASVVFLIQQMFCLEYLLIIPVCFNLSIPINVSIVKRCNNTVYRTPAFGVHTMCWNLSHLFVICVCIQWLCVQLYS